MRTSFPSRHYDGVETLHSFAENVYERPRRPLDRRSPLQPCLSSGDANKFSLHGVFLVLFFALNPWPDKRSKLAHITSSVEGSAHHREGKKYERSRNQK